MILREQFRAAISHPSRPPAQRRRTRILISVRLNRAKQPLHQTPRHLPYISKKSLHYSIYKKETMLFNFEETLKDTVRWFATNRKRFRPDAKKQEAKK